MGRGEKHVAAQMIIIVVFQSMCVCVVLIYDAILQSGFYF